jgi:peroxiredoxin
VTVTDVQGPDLHSLRGKLLPPVELESTSGHPLDLAAHTNIVIYLYPGAAGIIRGDETPLLDAVQHRAFRDHLDDFAACRFTVVGMSSQSTLKQRHTAHSNKLLHELVSDPTFRVAEALNLPTLRIGAVRVYERLTLLVKAGRVDLALDPRPTPDRHPAYLAQLLRHLQR